LTLYEVISITEEGYTVLKRATILRYAYHILSILLSRKHAVSQNSCLLYLKGTFHHA